MKSKSRSLALFFFAALSAAPVFAIDQPVTSTKVTTDALQQGFVAPPNSARPTVRWWWFGPAVVKPQLEREMNFMKEGGFGGFEIQPTYPLATDGQYPGLVNLKFLSPEFFDMIGFTAAKAKELGLRFDLTLGSGWPYGGPMITREETAQTLGASTAVTIAAGQTSVDAPAGGGRGAGGGAIAVALLGPVTDAAPGAGPYIQLKVTGRTAELPADLHGATQVLFFPVANAGLTAVKRPAYGAEGPVVDHYGPEAIGNFIKSIAEPEILACGPNTPYSIFCDSLEITNEGWTPTLLDEFKKRRGYDLAPYLPDIFGAPTAETAGIHRDYGKTVMEVFDDNFVSVFDKLAKDHNSLFRIQAYGTPPTSLNSYADADLDEGEGTTWRAFDCTRWAASASHLLGRAMTSSESFTWLHGPVFTAAPIDIKNEANLQFLTGVNQLLCHGWPYTPPNVEYPGWHFYVAAVFNEKNPWWIAMPDINNYLARMSEMLRQGAPANDVALYLPEEDAMTGMTPSAGGRGGAGGGLTMAQTGGLLSRYVNAEIPQILDSGYDFDFVEDSLIDQRGTVDGATLAFGDSKYKVIVLPSVNYIPLATYRKIEQFANNGGILIAINSVPSLAPGHLATAQDNQAISDISARLFQGPNAKGILLASAGALAQTLNAKLRPDVAYTQTHSELGFVHRHTDTAEIYYLANTSNQPVSDTAIFRVTGMQPEWWDPTTGRVTPAKVDQVYSVGTAVKVSLPAYGAQLLVFTQRQLPAAVAAAGPAPAPMDLSKDWSVTFKSRQAELALDGVQPEADPAPMHLDAAQSWTDTAALQSFSGSGTYEKSVDVPAAMVQTGLTQWLDFGDGQPANLGGGAQGTKANYQPPIGDAAVVYINGTRAGAVWCPPYRIDVTGLLKAGTNQIKIEVANRAINYLSAHAEGDMNSVKADPLLGTRANPGGVRESNENLSGVKSLPSGLLGPVSLIAAAPGS
jgi:hypothetical protein